MECKYNCFDRVMHRVQPLPESSHQEAVELIQADTLMDLLEYCAEHGCFAKEAKNTIYEGIIIWEDLDGSYFEEDGDKLRLLYDKIGITADVFMQYAK